MHKRTQSASQYLGRFPASSCIRWCSGHVSVSNRYRSCHNVWTFEHCTALRYLQSEFRTMFYFVISKSFVHTLLHVYVQHRDDNFEGFVYRVSIYSKCRFNTLIATITYISRDMRRVVSTMFDQYLTIAWITV